MKKKKGFTLIELVIVIAILLVLVTIAIPRFTKSHLNAQAAAHNINVKELRNAGVMYQIEHPDHTGAIDATALGEYIEGDVPQPAKGLGDNFTVSVGTNGEVTVSPGEVEVSGDQLQAVQ
ncbi:prepilin-type N-terminal cleavage/methylation domain-containing protein [Peptoniphilus equinus]|uniref:Prepilin-type N-terminal cleavage/methylation domain-containing protein n=1 Tax=Peptoniphilus equinus TaxID=3016343 RepID=A0ABY7QR88_9FIRM|nr:prepilin-type N-terminal cleavage/methylation domain-containing protein [Peptoniphilus equinus]WBW49284.1 prepilin-type N-terminal cleavage/methylation domain-containing protein [Peptoniphilus equinus]